MAKGLIEIALQLGSKLGANTSKFLGTRSNVSFLGTGPKDGMLFQKPINPESFATIGIEKVIPDIESSLAYATGGKLNDIELSTLIKNLKTMDETINPTNVVEMGGAGLDSLRAKSGLGERQVTEAASDIKPVDESNVAGMRPTDDTLNKLVDEHSFNVEKLRQTDAEGGTAIGYEEFKALQKRNAQIEEVIKNARKVEDESAAFPSFKTTENIDTSSPLMSKLENRIGGMRDNTPVSGNQLLDKFSEIKNRPAGLEETGDVTGIMQTIDKVDLPGKRAASREFLVNSLKVGDDYPSTTLTDVMSAQDMKFVMEGGGGVMGDPIVLVQKYFGPRIAEMVPTGGTAEEISIFTRRVMDNVEDAKGLRPDEPDFDPLTAKFVDNLADGGRAGYAQGGLAKILEL